MGQQVIQLNTLGTVSTRAAMTTSFKYPRNVIYQLSDIGMDDQIPEGEIWIVIYQTRCFVPNILRDDYVIHFLAFG